MPTVISKVLRIVETAADQESLSELISYQPSYIVALPTDPLEPPCRDAMSVLAVLFPDDPLHTLWIVPNTDINPTVFPTEILSHLGPQLAWTVDVKRLYHFVPEVEQVKDALGLEYLCCADVEPLPQPPQVLATGRYKRNYRLAPLMVLVEYAERLIDRIDAIVRQHATTCESGVAFRFHQRVIIPTLVKMETAGVAVDDAKFKAHYSETTHALVVRDSRAYTEYNPYTSVGRITGRRLGWNSSAINKSDGTREAFVSRMGKDGTLLMIDYESFHLRLIAHLIDWTFPDDRPVHEYLAGLYFNTLTPTQEQYDAGKILTFQNLYDDNKDVSTIPFFVAIREFVAQKFHEFQRDGWILSSAGRRIWLARMEDPTPKKLFNHLLQVQEMEVSVYGIHNLLDRLAFAGLYGAVATLYTYDSVVLDVRRDHLKQVCREIRPAMELGGKYPVRVWMGPDYAHLQSITDTVRTM